jgi:hypothetical protein
MLIDDSFMARQQAAAKIINKYHLVGWRLPDQRLIHVGPVEYATQQRLTGRQRESNDGSKRPLRVVVVTIVPN